MHDAETGEPIENIPDEVIEKVVKDAAGKTVPLVIYAGEGHERKVIGNAKLNADGSVEAHIDEEQAKMANRIVDDLKYDLAVSLMPEEKPLWLRKSEVRMRDERLAVRVVNPERIRFRLTQPTADDD